MRIPLAPLLLLLTIALRPGGQIVSADDAGITTQQSEVSAEAQKFVPRCAFASGKASATKLELSPDPILRWSNPTAGDVHGEVYVWTDYGRPAIVVSYFHWFSPDWGTSLEISSCLDTEASASVDGVRFWKTRDAGMKRVRLDGVDAPAGSAPARLVQMRRMANEFVVHLEDTRNSNDGIKRNLRLLNRPVYRNPPPTEKSQYLDGALFTFVEGTDPEVLLYLEAIEMNGAAFWNFGLSRMNRDAMKVKHRDAVVWTAPHIEQVMGRVTEPYALFSLRERFRSVDESDAIPARQKN